MQKLSRRLQAVANLAVGDIKAAESGCAADKDKAVENGCVADIGTDHGYIPIWLVEQNIFGHAIAMDIGKGSLQRAREHIEEQQLGAYIETRLSDGLAALKPGEAQVIIIAGMGGATMREILTAGEAVIEQKTKLILQPQSELMEFRQYLFSHGYQLLEEDMVEEDGKYYPMMKVQRTGLDAGANQPEHLAAGQVSYTEAELCYGPMLLAQKHPVLKQFLLWQKEQKEKLLLQLKSSADTDRGKLRKSQIESELAVIREVLWL